jgi:hypothetical protein
MSENDKGEGGASVPPIHWTVEAVVSWLREVGFDEDVCDKFERMLSHCSLDTSRTVFGCEQTNESVEWSFLHST